MLVIRCLQAAAAKYVKDCKCGTVKERRAMVLEFVAGRSVLGHLWE